MKIENLCTPDGKPRILVIETTSMGPKGTPGVRLAIQDANGLMKIKDVLNLTPDVAGDIGLQLIHESARVRFSTKSEASS